MNMFEALCRREDYKRKMMRENPLLGRVNAFVGYNAAYLITIASWMAWMGFIVGWSIVVTWNIVDGSQQWRFACAQYFAVSICLSAGSLSLPPDSLEWAYLLPECS
jgi:hypothetical protein